MRLLAILAAGLMSAAAANAESAPGLERAMSAELHRAVNSLDEPGYPPPYFASLAAIDVETFERRCAMGAMSVESSSRQRLLVPDLRVGDFAFDNHPVSAPSGYAAVAGSFQDDELSLRHALWLMFDGAYKNASADFLRKQALRVSRGKTEYDTDDLSKEEPRERRVDPPAALWPAGMLESLCAAGGRAFRAYPGLLEAASTVRRRGILSRVRGSDGIAVDHGSQLAELELSAVDISTDGLRLYALRRFTAVAPEGLPSETELARQAREMVGDLSALKVAQTTSPFSAPTLIDPSVAGAVVLAFGLRLSGEEQRDPGGAQIFRGKLDKRVLPEDFSLVDDPTREAFEGTPLIGHYDFDDQGIAPQRTELIKDGVLKGFLLSRYPVIGFHRSNGHGRSYPGYVPVGTPGNIFLTSRSPRPEKELLEALRKECLRRGKPYGLWVKKLRRFVQQQGTGGHGSIRLMPEMLYLVDAKTGALTLVRDLDLVGTPLDLMNNIVGAGADAAVQNISWNVPVSVITPSLLLADAELQRAETKPEKPPILPPPPAEAAVRRPVPTFAVAPYIEIVRYRIAGFKGPVTPFVLDGLLALRSHGEGEDTIIDAKLTGHSLGDLGASVRRMRKFVGILAKSAKVSEEIVQPAMMETAYRGLHGQGWPEDGPKP